MRGPDEPTIPWSRLCSWGVTGKARVVAAHRTVFKGPCQDHAPITSQRNRNSATSPAQNQYRWVKSAFMLADLFVEHFALRAQTVTLLHQRVNFLASLQDTLDGFMQDYLCFVQLFLNFHDRVRLLRILVFLYVLFELRKGHITWCGLFCESRAWIRCQEFVNNFGEELVSDKGRVIC